MLRARRTGTATPGADHERALERVHQPVTAAIADIYQVLAAEMASATDLAQLDSSDRPRTTLMDSTSPAFKLDLRDE